MKNLAYIFFLTLSMTLLSCSVLDEPMPASLEPEMVAPQQDQHCRNEQSGYSACVESSALAPNALQKTPSLFAVNTNFQILREYTEQMAMDIKQDLNGTAINEHIAVASFVYFNNNLKSTSPLGNQLAEFFINELQGIGLPVSDHKLTELLTINKYGDFSLSRNIDELNPNIEIGYIFTGTMVQSNTSVIINARLIHRGSNRVVASTSKLIPNVAIDEIH